MDNEKNSTITKNRYKYNYQKFDKIHFTHRRKYYDNVTPHWHDFYELEMVIGKGNTTINDTVYYFEHGAICFMTPTSIHSYLFEQEDFECYNLNFDIKYLDSENVISLLSQSKSTFFALSEQDIDWYLRIFSEFEKDYDKSKPFSRLYSSKILEFLIMNTLKYGSNSDYMQAIHTGQSTTPIPSAVLYIQKNFRKDIRMKDVADSVWLSEKYFSHLFRQETGHTFSEYLTDIRLRNACHMLVHAKDPVTEIARDSGFNSPKHFQRTFKKHYGITPLEYRKLNLGNKSYD